MLKQAHCALYLSAPILYYSIYIIKAIDGLKKIEYPKSEKIFNELNGYNEAFKYCEDLELIDRIYENSMFVVLKNKVITVFGGKQKRPNIHIDDITDLYLFFLKKKMLILFGIQRTCQNQTIGE